MNSRLHDLFDTAQANEDDSLEFLPPGRRPARRAWFVAGAAVLVALAGWWAISKIGFGGTSIELTGPRVGQLESGMPIVLADMRIGSVASVRLDDGWPVADLRIDRQFASELPKDCRFVVGALGDVFPGNVGVRVMAGKHSEDQGDGWLGGRSVERVRMAIADDSVLPTSTPAGMYVLIAVAVLVVAIAVGISLKVARSPWFRQLAITVAVVAIIFLFAKGIIDLDDVHGWIQWGINLIRGGSETVETQLLQTP